MKKHNIFLVYFLMILCTSCAKNNLTIQNIDSKITINGLITTDSLFKISISKSDYITNWDDSLNSIDNAQVLVYQNNNVIDSLLYDIYWDVDVSNSLFHHSNYKSKKIFHVKEKEYKIVVKAPDVPEASAITIIPNPVRIEHVDTSRIRLSTESAKNLLCFKCNIEFTDPSDETNYYLLDIFKKYKEYNYSYSEILPLLSDDPIVEEKLLSKGSSYFTTYATRGIAFSDKIINGKKSNLAVIICCDDIGLPFWNDDSEADKDDNHRKVVYFRLYSITEDYFKYIQTLNQYYKNYDNPLSDPVQVYSNVTGGYGIFAGAAVSSDSLVFTY
jgi:hypothetical protein